MCAWLNCPIRGVLLDITGVLYESGEGHGEVIEGSVDSVQRLKDAGIEVRLVTNETCATSAQIVQKLQHHGYKVSEGDIFSPVPAVLSILKKECLTPHLLVHPAIRDEFKDLKCHPSRCVVLGDADTDFTFENMNAAFRALKEMGNPRLFALGKGKFYKHKGVLQLDVGAFAAALEFACDIKAEVVGKPSLAFFGAALSDMGLSAHEVVMIGDDVVSDVNGAQECGMRGVLVRTGKFTQAWNYHQPSPDCIADNLAQATEMILAAKNKWESDVSVVF